MEDTAKEYMLESTGVIYTGTAIEKDVPYGIQSMLTHIEYK